MNDLNVRFAGLGPNDKVMFLARVAHMATIAARESCVPTADRPERNHSHPDAIILRDANSFVHRVTGYMMHVLKGTEMAGQDESVMMMIENYYRQRGLGSLLSEWLGTSD
jgi:hypothetical protein